MPDFSNIKELMNKIRKVVIGTDKATELSKINKSLTKLSQHSSPNSIERFHLMINSLLQQNNSNQKTLQDILKEAGIDLRRSSIEQDRLSRYKEYENIIEKIPYMKRAIKVIQQNILYTEDYTRTSYRIEIATNNKILKDAITSIFETNIKNRLDEVVFNTLLYGDFFVEIVTDDLINDTKLLETNLNSFDDKIISEDVNIKDRQIKLIIETNASDNKKVSKQPKDYFLLFHTPDKVIKIGDEIELGYLVISGNTELMYTPETFDVDKDSIITNITSSIIKNIKANKKVKEKIKQSKELKIILTKLIVNSKVDELKVRYVSPDQMQHFVFNKDITKLRPYGASVLYGSEFLAKIVIAIQSSIMIQRLTRSSDRQLVFVDIGASRDVRTYIEMVREALQRRRYTVDGVKVDDIPSIVTSYEYLYLPTKEGKRYVEFDQWSPAGEPSSRIDDLKTLRDALVASIEVPPAYVGIEENIESKATLSEQNIIFANTIVYYQKQLSKHLNALINKILAISKPGIQIPQFSIEFTPPLSLLAERMANYFDNISRLVESGKSLDIPKEYFFTKFFYLDEKDLEEMKVKEKLIKILQKKSNEENNNEFGGIPGEEGGEEFEI